MRTVIKIRKDLLSWKGKHHLLLHPKRGIDHWATLVLKCNGGCPCVPSRKHCPCPESLEDIKEEGVCRCGFFYSKEGLNILKQMVEEYRKGRVRVSPPSKAQSPHRT